MLTSIFRALSDHLAQLGLPFHLADCVPEGAALPYITADVRPPLAPHTAGLLTLTIWCAGTASNADRLSRADSLLSLLPARGFHLATDAGTAVLRQEGGAVCVREAAVHGVRTLWKFHFIPAE